MALEDGWYRLRKNATSSDETIVLIVFGRVIHAHGASVPWRHPEVIPTFIISEPPGEELEDWLWEKMPTPAPIEARRSYVLAQGASGDPPAARYGNFVFWFIIGVLVSAMAAIQVLGR